MKHSGGAADTLLTPEIDGLVRRLRSSDALYRPLLAMSYDCALKLERDCLSRLLNEAGWGGVVIRCDEVEPRNECLIAALEAIRQAAANLPLHMSVRVETIANALGERFWEHERYRLSAQDRWKRLLPKGGYAFALSVANPSHCITLCTPSAQVDEHLLLPVGEYEFHIWRRCNGSDSLGANLTDADWRCEQLKLLLSPFQGLVDGIIVDCSTLILSRRFGRRRISVRRILECVFEEALNYTSIECNSSEVSILRSICYDPSLDADRTRLSFWRGIARAYRRLFILPIANALNELNLCFAIDFSGWRNPLSPFILIGDIGLALKRDADMPGFGVPPMLITSCNAIGLRIFRALLGASWNVAVRVSPEDGDELKLAFTAAKHGADAFVSDVFYSPELPEWLLASAYAGAPWWLSFRKTVNENIARMLNIGRMGHEHSPAAAVITVRHMLSKLCMTRIRDEAADMITAWSELLELFERFHLSCDWVSDDDLANASICEKLPLQVASVSVERSGLRIRGGCYTAVILPTPRGLSKAAWMALSQLHNAGGSIFLVGPPPSPPEITPETNLLKWVQSCSRSYEARFAYAREFDMPLDDLSPVTYQSADGGCLGMFDWRICPDKVESALMVHRMLSLSIRSMAETHHTSIKTMLRWFEETPIVLTWNESDEIAEFRLRVRCVGRVVVWSTHCPECPKRHLHYAVVEDEVDSYGSMCMVISLELPPKHWCAISIPPGAETHIAASNFLITDVNMVDEIACVRGYARKPELKATICIGYRAFEFEAHAGCIPEDEARLDETLKLDGAHFDAVGACELGFNLWRAKLRFPWALLHRCTPWHIISSSEHSIRIERSGRFREIQLRSDVERPPNCKNLMLRFFNMPDEWLALTIDGQIVAVNAGADLDSLRRLKLAEAAKTCRVINGYDTGWLRTEGKYDRHEVILWTLLPHGGELKLPNISAVFELSGEEPLLLDSIMLALGSMSSYKNLRLMRSCEYGFKISPPTDVNELLLVFDSPSGNLILIGDVEGAQVASSPCHLRIELACDGERRLKVFVGDISMRKLQEGEGGNFGTMRLRWRVAFGIKAVSRVRAA
ncbi:MAG: hypothetical protein NZ781_06400 [Armatimonadetes bacterium]|nr:hypothetical protein [Armatimonadota bacterium]